MIEAAWHHRKPYRNPGPTMRARWDMTQSDSSSSSGVVFVDYAGNGALLRFAYPTVAPRGALQWSSGRRSACYCG
ncbi:MULTISPECIES: hypothetical protein [Mycolicibacterium]|uniref:hypothetical protein n=1 Tax=Mycolicibacterium TaxID=1866885 RepID=UPI001558B63F|nr:MULTISPECIES: hypothetical protein [Mycolicibacterium]MBU8813382.1 hypothetical protein [Mycolicibacterium goodii]MCV7055310.1 hypothetical protein [Mycolicibacterium gilvum]